MTSQRLLAARIARNLNRLIEARNLYRADGRRYVFAGASNGEVSVENLHTGIRETFNVADGWRDGRGEVIHLADLR